MTSSSTRVIGCTAPAGTRRPGNVRSRRSAARACSRSWALSASTRAAIRSSSCAFAALASAPTRGRPAASRARAGAPSARPSGPGRGRGSARGQTWSGPRRCPPGPDRGSPGPGGPPPRSGALGSRRLRQLGEGGGVLDGQLGEDLPVEPDAGLLEPRHEGGVGHPELTAGRVHADDPQRPGPPLLLLAPLVGENAGAQDGLRRRAVELAPAAKIALRLLEDFLPALAGLGPALCPWHRDAPLFSLPLPFRER